MPWQPKARDTEVRTWTSDTWQDQEHVCVCTLCPLFVFDLPPSLPPSPSLPPPSLSLSSSSSSEGEGGGGASEQQVKILKRKQILDGIYFRFEQFCHIVSKSFEVCGRFVERNCLMFLSYVSLDPTWKHNESAC